MSSFRTAAVSNLTPAEAYCIEHGYLALDENGCFNGRGELSADAFMIKNMRRKTEENKKDASRQSQNSGIRRQK